MKEIVNVAHARKLARRRLPRMVFDFIDGGAEDEVTLRLNERDFSQITFCPQVCVDVSNRDQTTTVFGKEISTPVMLAPVGFAGMVSRGGDLAIARAAGKIGTIFAASTASNFTLEEIAEAATGPLWFQLYMHRDRDVTKLFVEKAQGAGYHVLCPSVDVPVVGKRERDLHNGLTVPPRIKFRNILDTSWRLAWLRDFLLSLLSKKMKPGNYVSVMEGDDAVTLATFVSKSMNPAADWSDFAWLRDIWKGPLVIKGVMSAKDAILAVDHGADGIVVSNHGGRQLDGSPSTISVLPEIVDAVGGRAEVFVDGGIRRGTDVVKAIALGARACFVGRPYMWGLAIGGEAGIVRVVEILREEIDRTLALIGRPNLREVNRSVVDIGSAQ